MPQLVSPASSPNHHQQYQDDIVAKTPKVVASDLSEELTEDEINNSDNEDSKDEVGSRNSSVRSESEIEYLKSTSSTREGTSGPWSGKRVISRKAKSSMRV